MLSQSEPLLQALLVGAAAIETVAVPISTFDSTGQIVHHWNVDSTDPKTGNAAHLLWNADTDELVRVSQCRQNDRAGEYRDSSIQQDAVGLAWDWFHAMKMNRPLEDWHFIGARKKHFSEWDIYLRSGDRYTIMTIKTDTGQLVHALCGHLPSANMVWEPSKTRTDA